mgnify:CR=1 FL=1
MNLSTPSLGITYYMSRRRRSGSSASGFQLPLSGSQTIEPTFSYRAPSLLSTPSLGITIADDAVARSGSAVSFQLPLSGSPGKSPVRRIAKAANSFNSLSRDHFAFA